MPLHQEINITVKQSSDSGSNKLQVFINESKVHEVGNPTPIIFEEVNAYAGDTLSRPVDGTVTQLRILPGKIIQKPSIMLIAAGSAVFLLYSSMPNKRPILPHVYNLKNF